MWEYIKGILTEASPAKAVVEIQGIGYQLHIPLSTYGKLPQIGKEVLFYIASVIREDSHRNYGFLVRQERDLFEKFCEISGIGPKTSLGLVGHMEVGDLQRCIAQGNVALLCKVPGIGKKTAERLMIELKDKIKITTGSSSTFGEGGKISDAISALINLGYPAARADKAIQTALSKSQTEPPLAELITQALRHI